MTDKLPAAAPRFTLESVQKRIDEGDILGARAEFNAGVQAKFGKHDAVLERIPEEPKTRNGRPIGTWENYIDALRAHDLALQARVKELEQINKILEEDFFDERCHCPCHFCPFATTECEIVDGVTRLCLRATR